MQNLSIAALSGNDYEDGEGQAIDASQLFSASFLASFGDDTAVGTFKLQASNDIPPAGAIDFEPTNWADIPNQSANVTGGASKLLTLNSMAFRWVRPTWTMTATGQQSITCIDAGYGAPQIVTVVMNDDVSGNLNNTYWLIYSTHDANAYYVWYDVDNTGVNPSLPGKTGIEVDISEDDTAEDIATATIAAMSAAASAVFTFDQDTSTIIVYNQTAGTASPAEDGAVPTGFAVSTAQPGADPAAEQVPNSSYFLLDASEADGGAQYYVWFSLNDTGVDPTIPDRTGLKIVFYGTDIANGFATSIQATLVSDAPEFTDITVPLYPDPGNETVTFSNVSAGPFVPAQDFNTGFTFEVLSGGSSTISVTMDALGI